LSCSALEKPEKLIARDLLGSHNASLGTGNPLTGNS
jgi:hypothetical protein